MQLESRTIIDNDIKHSACLVFNDAVEKGHVRLISNVELAAAFLFDHFSVLFGTYRLVINERYLAVWKVFGPQLRSCTRLSFPT